MSTVIHHKLAKNTQQNQQGFVGSLSISFQIICKLQNALLTCLSDDHIPQLEEIVSNFEMINKRIFSVAG